MLFKVVIVEDNPATVRSLLQTIDWHSLGCEVVGTAADGESGRLLLMKEKPDIVLTDIRMPQKDGLQMIEEAREACPDCKVIIITGYDQFQYASRAIKLAVFDYILKPVQNDDVLRAVTAAADMICRQRETSREIVQAGMLKRRAMLTALITNDSQRGLGISNLLVAQGMDFRAYYIMAMQLADERMIPQFTINHMDAVFSKRHINAVTLLLYDTVVVFVMHENAEIDWRGEASQLVTELSSGLVSPLHAGISQLHTSRHEIRHAYRQASQALWEMVLRRNPHGYNFYVEGGTPQGSDRIGEMSRQIDELIEQSDLSEEWAVHVAEVLTEQSRLVASNLRAMVMLYTMALRRKFSFPLNDHCNCALNDIWFVTCKEDVSSCLVRLSAGLKKEKERQEQGKQSLLTKNALQYIHLHAIEGLRLDDVAKTLCVSGNYLSTLIRKETGVTFYQHVLEAKMKVACTLLADPRMLVEEVAHAVGYRNYISFYSAFKRVEHMTPTEYRNQKVEV